MFYGNVLLHFLVFVCNLNSVKRVVTIKEQIAFVSNIIVATYVLNCLWWPAKGFCRPIVYNGHWLWASRLKPKSIHTQDKN